MLNGYLRDLAAAALAGCRQLREIGRSVVGLLKRVWVCALMALALVRGGVFDAQQAFSVPGQAATAVLAASRIPGPAVPDGLGVNIHFTNPRPGEMRMLAATGVRWIRMDFAWGATETQKGRYNFAAYVRLITALRRYHIRPLLILDYGNPLYQHGAFPTTPAARQAFAAWAAAAVENFRGSGVVWEMWNEPDGGMGNGGGGPIDPQAYAKLALETGQAIRRADQHAVFIGPALAWMQRPWKDGLTWVQWIFKGGVLRVFDAVSVHPYREQPPETVIGDYRLFRRVANRGRSWGPESRGDYRLFRGVVANYAPAGRSPPLVSSEWGYPSVPEWFYGRGYSSSTQARFLAREFLVNLMCHVRLSIWYDWHDDGPAASATAGTGHVAPPNPEFHFGMVGFTYHAHRHWVYTPKPAFFACRTLTHTLCGFHFDKRLKENNPRDFVLVFANGHRRRWVAWSEVKPKPGRGVVTLPVPSGTYRVINYLGAEHITTKAGVAGLKLQLSTGPQYIVPQRAK